MYQVSFTSLLYFQKYAPNKDKIAKLGKGTNFIKVDDMVLVFGLGLACQAKGQCCHTKKSTLAKIFTEENE